MNEEVTESVATLLEPYLHNKDRLNVLEIGHGNGDLTRCLYHRFPNIHITGVDLNNKLGSSESLYSDRLHFVYGQDILTWSGPKDPLDIILCVRSLHFIPDVQKLMRLLRLWMNPKGGHFVNVQIPLFRIPLFHEEFVSFVNETFAEELRGYWSQESGINFIQYCCPSRSNKSLLLGSLPKEVNSISIESKISLIHLDLSLEQYHLVRSFLDRKGRKELNIALRTFQSSVLKYYDHEFEDLWFEDVILDTVIDLFVEVYSLL